MKKFLSLVLALVMTMSLVTIGAGATDYKDLKDKSEIQYEEAVAVLNKIGIITGYEDGSFKPTGALTRGAAAKIIVSLMIGSEAASSLTVAAAPYKDVPVTNTFAAVISYCKTAGYINGYSDGTFRPTASLTGYAFAKMLLGALGYDGKIEGFTGNGWTMNVARLGSTAGLYNDFSTTFQGNDGVTREAACLLALNTLKATMVEYVGGSNISTSTGNATTNVVINAERQYKTSNNTKINKNIKVGDVVSAQGQYFTLEFGEEHFQDLKLVGDTTGDFGRPSTQWSYKNVTIGKFAKTPDFTFTAAPSGDNAKEKVKDMGLNSYKVMNVNANGDGTTVSINDVDKTSYFSVTSLTSIDNTEALAQKLVDLTGNGIVVEVYLDDDTADMISNIVVIRSQMMEVNTVSSKNITLKQADEVGDIVVGESTGKDPVFGGKLFKSVSSTKDSDDAFDYLKNCKSGDYMMVTYTGSGTTKDAYSAVAPTTVTGALTAITRNNSNVVNGVTVGGTAYKLAAIRDDDFSSLDAKSISSTKKDVTLYLDAYGYATYIKDAGTSTNFMIVGNTYSSLVNGKILTTVEGYDMNGEAISINVGSSASALNGAKYGDLVKYVSTSGNNADYAILSYNAKNTNPAADTKGLVTLDTSKYAKELKANATSIEALLADDNGNYVTAGTYTIASGVKTLFVDFDDDDGTVNSVSVKNGVANVLNSELTAKGSSRMATQMYINKDGAVEAIIVKTTSSDAVSDKVLYIESVKGDSIVDGVRTYTYHVWVNGAEDDYTSTDNLTAGYFATYAEKADGNYKLSAVKRTDSATSAFKISLTKANISTSNKNLIYGVNGNSVNYPNVDIGIKDMENQVVGTSVVASGTILNTTGAQFSDLKDKGFASLKDVYDFLNSTEGDGKTVDLTLIMNNKDDADNQYKVSAIAVTDIK